MAETVIIDRPSTEPASLPAIVEARATAIAPRGGRRWPRQGQD